jgi:hypothetical protein
MKTVLFRATSVITSIPSYIPSDLKEFLKETMLSSRLHLGWGEGAKGAVNPEHWQNRFY